MVAVREGYESLQIMLPRNEVARCLSEILCVAVDIAKVRGDMKMFLCAADSMQLIYVQLGTLGLRG